MNRDELKARLAKDLEQSAIRAHVFTVALPSGDKLSLRKLTNDQVHRAVLAAGDNIDMVIHSLRYSLVDDDGNQLIESFDEARQLYNSFSPDDFNALKEAMELMTSVGDDEAEAAGVEAVEAGKAS